MITTALIPGRPAPELITEAAVHGMRPGAVIVDLAAEAGGNCAATKPGETVDVGGVTIVGAHNVPATMPVHASQMYSRNIQAFLALLVKEGALELDFEDEIVRETCVAHGGQGHRRSRRCVSQALLSSITVFVLSVFLGIELISRVPALLHTPLMSGTNAIHGIVLVGAMLIAGSADSTLEQALAFVAVVFATINVVGGFLVTDRMLEMFKRRPERPEEPE